MIRNYMKRVVIFLAAVASADIYHPPLSVSSHGIESAPRPARSDAAAESSPAYWLQDAQKGIDEVLYNGLGGRGGKARNLVMFLGDGMSVPTLAAARTLLGQRQNRTGEESRLSFEKFPTVGLSKTYCVDTQIPDSACTATAYLCGVKNNYGVIGLSAEVPYKDCSASVNPSTHLDSIAAWALADGLDVGIVTTTTVTHASPAGAYAKIADRNWENDAAVREASEDPNQCPDIAYQLIHSHPGNKFKVILGGGRQNFLPITDTDADGSSGQRTDGRNLIEDWKTNKISRNASYEYVWTREQLLSATSDPPEYLLGLFASSHLDFHLQATDSEPTLAELTEAAIRTLSRNEKGFFLFVEGGRIDHGHHFNLVEFALDETIELSAAVERATELLPEEDSLIVVTSDHAHVMAFNGYTSRGSDILGPSDSKDANGVPYMTLSYTNGPGHRPEVDGVRPDVTKEATYRKGFWLSHVDVPLFIETHGGDDVAVFARGPHHTMFTGVYEQSHIPHRMAYVGCIGPGRTLCSDSSSDFFNN